MQGGGQQVTMMVVWRYTCIKQSLVSKSDIDTETELATSEMKQPDHQDKC